MRGKPLAEPPTEKHIKKLVERKRKEAHREAARIRQEAKKKAEREGAAIIAQARPKVREAVKEVSQQAREEAEKEAAAIIAEARGAAEQEPAAITAEAVEEVEPIVKEVKRKARAAGRPKARAELRKYPILKGKSEKRRKVKATTKAKEAPEPPDVKSSELYTGQIELVLLRPLDLDQVNQFEEYLKQVEDLSWLWSGGSADEGVLIAIQAERPMPLINILKEIPQVEKVGKKGKKITIRLKAPTSS